MFEIRTFSIWTLLTSNFENGFIDTVFSKLLCNPLWIPWFRIINKHGGFIVNNKNKPEPFYFCSKMLKECSLACPLGEEDLLILPFIQDTFHYLSLRAGWSSSFIFCLSVSRSMNSFIFENGLCKDSLKYCDCQVHSPFSPLPVWF